MIDVLEVIGKLLPVGLAAALSTVPITLMIVILLSPSRKAAAIPYGLGYLVGTSAIVTLTSAAAQLLPEPRIREPQTVVAVLEVLLGAALVVLGIHRLRHRRPADDGESWLTAWARSVINSIGPVRAFGLGLILGFRPKSVLLAGVVGLQVHNLDRVAGVVAVALGYVVIATSTVAVPVLLTTLSPTTMEPRLKRAAAELAQHGPLISVLVLVMVGVVVIGAGLQDL